MCLQCSKRSPVLETHRTSAKRSPFLDVHHTTITVIAAVDTLFYSCAVVSGLLNATKRASSSNCDTHSAIWALVGALDFELLIAHWVYRPCSTRSSCGAQSDTWQQLRFVCIGLWALFSTNTYYGCVSVREILRSVMNHARHNIWQLQTDVKAITAN